MSPQDVAHFVQSFVEAWARPDSDGFARLWREDGVFVHPTVAGPLRGCDVPPWSERVKASMPDMAFVAETWVHDGNLLMLQWTTAATVRGMPLRWSGVDRFRLVGGRIAEEVVYFDTLVLWTAIDPSMARPPLVQLAGAR